MQIPSYLCALLLLVMTSSDVAGQQAIGTGTDDNGDLTTWLIPAAGLATALFYEEGHEGTWQWFKALAVNELVVAGLKSSIDKTRPNGVGDNSFPSGHTARAFMGAAFIHERYGWKYSIPAYVGAAWVGYSRVDEDKHHTEDVLASAAIGIIASRIFTTPYERLEITPVAGSGYYGINVAYSW